MKSKIEELIKERKRATEDLIAAIISDLRLTKLEKLELIDEHRLFPHDTWIGRPLQHKYTEAFEKQIEEKYGKQDYHVIDSWPVLDCEHMQRGADYSYADLLQSEYENADYALNKDDASDHELEQTLVTVMTNRARESHDEYKITLKQLVDDIYDHCIEYRVIGFNFDW